MMTAPDRVDVDIPNTEEARMVGVRSSENLRRLVADQNMNQNRQPPGQNHHQHQPPPSLQAGLQSAPNQLQAQQQQQQQQPAAGIPIPPRPQHFPSQLRHSFTAGMGAGCSVGPAPSPGSIQGNGHRQLRQQQQQQQHRQHQQQQQQQQLHQQQQLLLHRQQQHQQLQQQRQEYTAWTIGSAESLFLRSHREPSSSPPPPPGGDVSPYASAILAKCRSLNSSPDPTEASSLPSVPSVTTTPRNATPTPPPPPVPHTAPTTLGGLSQGVVEARGGDGDRGGGSTAAGAETAEPMASAGNAAGVATVGTEARSVASAPAAAPAPSTPARSSAPPPAAAADPALRDRYHARLLSAPVPCVESLLASSCESLNFDIAEMWLRTGPKTHQLTNSHVRPTALDESVRKQLVDVYYGERSAERTHRLSPALCKRAKEAGDVVWVTAHTLHGAEALKCSISDVRTAVAVPVCHGGSGTNVTIIYFSIRRAIMKPQAVEFLVHMSLATAAAAVNSLAKEVMVDEVPQLRLDASVAEHDARSAAPRRLVESAHACDHDRLLRSQSQHAHPTHRSVTVSRDGPHRIYSVTGAQLNLQWDSLRNVEYLTDGGNNWIHTAVLHGRSVVVKTLKPECQDVALAINEIEGELEIHSRLDHSNIVKLIGAGFTPRGVRFVVLERLDGGTMTQLLGYDTRIRDRRRRFWTKKKVPYMDVLKCARSLADALAYCHGRAIPNVMVLHRDLKPDNVGFTLDGTVKLIDFGLARIVENASVSNEVYVMSGETGSLRYMAPEVADCQPYNQKADVYSFGIILWELVAFKKPYDGMNRDEFYSRVVHGGERPTINKKWPEDLTQLMKSCWDAEVIQRPNFSDIVEILDSMLAGEKVGDTKKKRKSNKFVSALIDRHSTWF